ncbi:MAG TPA: hypothetical protein VN812_19870, partial [Candidatus Acidoferrales bacterium]|nr:hypothetical protein [Candidatus Acidoferrales bacterium]
RAILHLCSAESEAPIPRDDLWLSKVVMWKTRIGDVVEADFGEDTFRAAKEAVRKAEKLSEKDLEKNTLFLGYVLEELCDQGKKSTSLERLCAAILDFAKAAKPS